MRIIADLTVTIEHANGMITEARQTQAYDCGDNPSFTTKEAAVPIDAARAVVLDMLPGHIHDD